MSITMTKLLWSRVVNTECVIGASSTLINYRITLATVHVVSVGIPATIASFVGKPTLLGARKETCRHCGRALDQNLAAKVGVAQLHQRRQRPLSQSDNSLTQRHASQNQESVVIKRLAVLPHQRTKAPNQDLRLRKILIKKLGRKQKALLLLKKGRRQQ